MILRSVKKFFPDFIIRRYERELLKETHINRALGLFRGETRYLEIGVRDGDCIGRIHAIRKYAIDPAPVAPETIERDGTVVFRMTSDRFFEQAAESELNGHPIHVALVDGLHEFRQTLRDVLSLEPLMAPGGVIFVHDCNPPTRRNAEDPSGPWNGDVWKVAHYLRRYRRDVDFFTLDCDWGLGVVSGFSGTPPEPRPEDIEAVASLDYEILEEDRATILNLRSPLSSLTFFAMRRLAGAR